MSAAKGKYLAMKRRVISLLLALLIVIPLVICIPGTAASAACLADVAAEIHSKYGFSTAFRDNAALEETLSILSAFPEGMIKELTDGYRKRGITSQIKEGTWSGDEDIYMDFGVVTGNFRINSNSIVITLYHTMALGHEIGHAIDYFLGKLAGRSRVSGALEGFNNGAKYGVQYVTDVFSSFYGSTSSTEDFAEIVESLFFSPEYVRTYISANPDTPLTRKYHFVMDLIVEKFASISSKESAFPLIFSIDVLLDGDRLEFEVPAQIINGRAVVPLRAIFEALGADIEWNEAAKTVTATKGDAVVVLTIGSVSPIVNGRVVTIDQPGIVISGRTMVPLRFVAEALSVSVNWDGTLRTVTITSE